MAVREVYPNEGLRNERFSVSRRVLNRLPGIKTIFSGVPHYNETMRNVLAATCFGYLGDFPRDDTSLF